QIAGLVVPGGSLLYAGLLRLVIGPDEAILQVCARLGLVGGFEVLAVSLFENPGATFNPGASFRLLLRVQQKDAVSLLAIGAGLGHLISVNMFLAFSWSTHDDFSVGGLQVKWFVRRIARPDDAKLEVVFLDIV